MRTSDDWALTTIDSDTLVSRLRKRDADAWRLANERYGPLLQAFARTAGLTADLAEEARQEALAAFAKGLEDGRFDRARGRLRSFLFGIARYKICDIHQREARQRRVATQPEDSQFFQRWPDDDALEAIWDAEWHQHVTAQCLTEARARFQPETFRAFVMHGLKGRASADVAATLGTTANAVDIATSRVRGYLRDIRPVIEEIF